MRTHKKYKNQVINQVIKKITKNIPRNSFKIKILKAAFD